MASLPLAGSERRLPQGARDLGPAEPGQSLEVSVILKRANALAPRLTRLARGEQGPEPLAHEAFAPLYGATADSAAAVAEFAARRGLTVVAQDLARRTVRLGGTAADMAQAFGVDLRRIETPEGVFRGRAGPILLDEGLASHVDAVLGLDDRPQARPQFRLARRRAAADGYTPLQVATLYGFPTGDGAGQTIALIELGGGYTEADLAAYFSGLGLAQPKVEAVPVDGAANAPGGGADSADGEVMLDIEVAGAIAPGADIAVYFAPNTDAGFVDAVTAAAHDAQRKPRIISISWGASESAWTAQAMTALDQAIASAAMLGITVLAASGDNGSSDGAGDGSDHVDFPASSPHALACGGTRLLAKGNAIAGESVWNDGPGQGAGGGGVSAAFPLPAWQDGLSATTRADVRQALGMRGTPDVAGDADPATGYRVRVDGQDIVVGGTSAVAPLWAGLIARINANLGRPAGFVNARLYGAAAAFNDITQGDNGDFAAAAGWDACTGLGSPIGASVQKALGQ